MAGVFVCLAGVWLTGLTNRFSPAMLPMLVVFILVVSLALVCFVTVLMVRIRDTLIARNVASALTIALLFPSGAVYPIAGFPDWMRAISKFDPFTYAVRGLHGLVLKQAESATLPADLAVLGGFAAVCFAGALALFPRRLQGGTCG
jgi:ABC-2 type transport system permease protein